VRHTCEQSDDMAGYGWDEYDVRTGGHQVIRDPGNSIDIHTEFVKVEGGENGEIAQSRQAARLNNNSSKR